MDHIIWVIWKPSMTYFSQFDHSVVEWRHQKCSKKYFSLYSWFSPYFIRLHFSLRPLNMAAIAFLINPFLIRWQLFLKLKLFRPILSFWSSFSTLIDYGQPKSNFEPLENNLESDLHVKRLWIKVGEYIIGRFQHGKKIKWTLCLLSSDNASHLDAMQCK